MIEPYGVGELREIGDNETGLDGVEDIGEFVGVPVDRLYRAARGEWAATWVASLQISQ